jgi:hypothetical protein
MAELIEVAKFEDVPPGTARVVTAGDRLLAVVNVDGTFYAVDIPTGTTGRWSAPCMGACSTSAPARCCAGPPPNR